MSFETFKKSQLLSRKSNNLSLLGFDFDNPNIEQEYLKIQQMLVTEYFIKRGSMLTIMKKFGIPSTRTMDILFREFCIDARNLSESALLSIESGRSDPVKNISTFQHLWHTTWDGKKVLLRSSHEQAFAISLDAARTKYEVECFRLRYFDAKRQANRIAVPDFYLVNDHRIVEVKSTYWLNVENMKAKAESYRRLGFAFSLFLDNQLLVDW